jgi:hypothetical protein
LLKSNNTSSPFFLFLFIIFVYIIFGAVSIFDSKAKIDEKRNHLPMLEGMYETGYVSYILSDEYNAANTPLPYLLPHCVYKIFCIAPNLLVPRIINLIISLLTILLFAILLTKISGIADYRVLIFLFYPYFIKTSFVFYLAIYGVFFILLALFFLLKEKNHNKFIGGLSTAGGLLSQQFTFALPIGYIISWFINLKAGKIKNEFAGIMFFLVPLLIPMFLFILWGGLTHPSWRFHNPSFDITHITAALTISGGVFFPFIIDKIRAVKIHYALIIIPSAFILSYFFAPMWAEYGEYGQVTGYTYNFLTKAGLISKLLSYLISFFLCSAGIYLFLIIYLEKKNDIEKLIFLVSLVFLIVFFFNNVFSERHLLPMMALLYLLTLPRIQKKWLLNAWVIYQILFGTVYYYYWIFIHPSFG